VSLDGLSSSCSVHNLDHCGDRDSVHKSPTSVSVGNHRPSTGRPFSGRTVLKHRTSGISNSYVLNGVARRVLLGAACPAARWVARREASNPSCERRAGVQARNLVRVGGLVPGKPSLTPAIRQGPAAAGSLRFKVAGGGGVKALSRCEEGRPGGGEAQEGRGSAGALTGSVDTALFAGSKALKTGMGSPARVKPQAPPSNARRA
jgi:hypothetical protein